MSILLQEEKIMTREETDRYWKDKAEQEPIRELPLWRFLRWLMRQP